MKRLFTNAYVVVKADERQIAQEHRRQAEKFTQ